MPQKAFQEAVEACREAAAKTIQFFKVALRRKIESLTQYEPEEQSKDAGPTEKRPASSQPDSPPEEVGDGAESDVSA